MAEPRAQAAPQPWGMTLSRRRIAFVIASVMLGMLLSALDQTVVGTAMPRIIADLNGLQHYAWVATGYLLASTASMPIWGKLSRRLRPQALLHHRHGAVRDRLGPLRPEPQSMTELIAFRALQGLGAGAMLPIVAGHHRRHLPAGPAGHVDRRTHERLRRGDHRRAAAGRLDHRQHRLALDLLRQPAGGHRRPGLRACGAARPRARCASTSSTTAAPPSSWPPPCRCCSAFSWARQHLRLGLRADRRPVRVLGRHVGGVLPARDARRRAGAQPAALREPHLHRLDGGQRRCSRRRCSAPSCSCRCSCRACMGKTATNSGIILMPLMLGAIVTSIGAGQILAATGRYKVIVIVGFVRRRRRRVPALAHGRRHHVGHPGPRHGRHGPGAGRRHERLHGDRAEPVPLAPAGRGHAPGCSSSARSAAPSGWPCSAPS